MKISIKVKPHSSEQKIECLGDGKYLAYLESVPKNNQANTELIRLVSKYFKIPSSCVKIKFGMSGRDKMVEII